MPHAVCDGNEPEQVVEAVESALHLTWRISRARADQDLRTLLMAKFSDDVRNAIHAIQGYAEILRDDAVAMQYLVPGWTFDRKRPCLAR